MSNKFLPGSLVVTDTYKIVYYDAYLKEISQILWEPGSIALVIAATNTMLFVASGGGVSGWIRSTNVSLV
jgi:hypothetical protein